MLRRLVSLLEEELTMTPFGHRVRVVSEGDDWAVVTVRVLSREVEVTRLGLVEDQAFALVGYHPLLAPFLRAACERAKVRFNRGGK